MRKIHAMALGALVGALALATPALATGSIAGQYCGNHGATKISNGVTYVCSQAPDDEKWRWRPVASPSDPASPSEQPFSPAASPSEEPSPDQSGSADASEGAAAPLPTTPVADGGGLPVTGAPAGLLAAGGLLVVGTGVGAVLVGRRRRQRFAA